MGSVPPPSLKPGTTEMRPEEGATLRTVTDVSSVSLSPSLSVTVTEMV